MTDRELLELAAKAAGIELAVFDGKLCRISHLNELLDVTTWNPLEDDGDALRLAVKLNMKFTCAHKFSGAAPFDGGPGFDIPNGDDPTAATRRAIVRTAAAIGAGK